MSFALLEVPGGLLYASTALGPIWDRLGVDWGSVEPETGECNWLS